MKHYTQISPAGTLITTGRRGQSEHEDDLFHGHSSIMSKNLPARLQMPPYYASWNEMLPANKDLI
jgi:hypothetical protein